jgi:D-alanyl-D-alanine carboxypeptidase/D-alanyl-D-alanine-endopeptidase (penicillin-binding protein 4)
LAGFRIDESVPLVEGPCADWRGGLRADFADPGYARLGGTYAAACGEKTWPMAYPDPASFNSRLIEAVWLSMGGRLHGVVRDGAAPFRTADFEMTSPPLAQLVRDINKFSNNVMAQQLFLTLPLVQRAHGSTDAAREIVRGWLADRLGDDGRAAVVDNGSGLSRETRLSAQALSRLLRQAWNGPVMPELMSSLPVVGIDGTLQRWLAERGRAHLKTGSLRDVFGVAGFVLAESGRRRVVVAIVNHPNANQARPVLDALVHWAVTERAPPQR